MCVILSNWLPIYAIKKESTKQKGRQILLAEENDHASVEITNERNNS